MRFKTLLQFIYSGLISGFFLLIFILLIILVAQGLNNFLQLFFHLDLISNAQLIGWRGLTLSLIPFVMATALVTTLMIQLYGHMQSKGLK